MKLSRSRAKTTDHMTKQAVLLIGFGGPTRSDEIRPFLDNVLRGRSVPRERIEEVAHHYELIGGRSPFNELTFRQADGLRRLLEKEGPPIPVYAWPLASQDCRSHDRASRPAAWFRGTDPKR